MENHRKSNLLKRILESKSLPSLSPLAIQLVELATDDLSSVQDLTDIIEKDPALTTRLLKLVGSAFFGIPERVHSISQAVLLLGFKRLRIMALSLSLRETFTMGTKSGIDYDHFWKSSLYRAMIARSLAESFQAPDLNHEEAFVAGLILEIGMLMLYEVCTEDIRHVFPGANTDLEQTVLWEEEKLGINHREIGSLVLKRWRFSDQLVESQRYFGPEALSHERSLLCKTVELARRATQIVFGQRTDLYNIQKMVNDTLKLRSGVLDEIFSETFFRIEVLAEQLRIKIDSQDDILTVMEKANETLARINNSMEKSLQGLLNQVGEYDNSLTQISEEMARSRGEILQNTLDAVAHEIRNPLLAIGGFANRLATQGTEEERGRKYARIIAEESNRLEGVLKEIIDYCQAYEPTFVKTDLTSIADDVLDEFKSLFKKKDIEIVKDFPEKPAVAAVDTDGISRVFRRLLKNSIDMIDEADGRLTVSIKTLQTEGLISITIADNGHPVPEALKDALLDSNLSTKTFGDGLGLPMARRIIEAHRGNIELKIDEQRGNCVIFHIPVS